MASKGYASTAEVAAYLGLTFTSPQNTQADALIEAAELYVDRTTHRVWKVGATVTNEDHYGLDGPYIWLRQPPITGVTSIVRRWSLADTSPLTLVAGVDYEVEDLPTGRISLRGVWDAVSGEWEPWLLGSNPRYRVTYTTANTVDADIALATKMLVAHWMRPLLEGIGSGIQSYSVGGELSVTYASAALQSGIPDEVGAILKARTRLVIA